MQRVEPGVGVDRQPKVDGFMGFFGIVRSLTQTPHSLPEIPNLKPVALAMDGPQAPLTCSDDDGVWTVDDSLESADQQCSVFEQKPLGVHAVQYAYRW